LNADVFTGEGIRAKVLEQYGESKCQTHILSVAHQQIEEGYLVSVYANQKQGIVLILRHFFSWY